MARPEQVDQPVGELETDPKRRSTLRWALLAVVAGAAGALTGPYISADMPEQWARVSAASIASAGVGSYAMLRWLRPKLGAMTAVAAVALTWGLVLGGAAQLPADCPGVGGYGRCGVKGTSVYVMLGMLWVAFVAAVALPPVAVAKGAARGIRALWRRRG